MYIVHSCSTARLQRSVAHRAMRYTLFLVLSFLLGVVLLDPRRLSAQVLLYNDIFNGGVCADGFATDERNYGNPAELQLDVPPGAQIRKAFLLAGEHFSQGDPRVIFDGKPYRINVTTRTTGPFATAFGQEAYLHLLDITDDFDPLLSVHTLEAPEQLYPSNRFNEFYVVVCYESPAMNEVEVSIYGNNQDFQGTMRYSILQHDVSLATPYALAIMGGYICRRAGDGELVFVNGNYIGTLDTNDKKSGTCGGPVGSFRFENEQLFGVGDDTPDDRMGRSDALANIASYLREDATSMNLDFTHSPGAHDNDNSIWAAVTVSGSGCRRQFASADTLICRGEELQLLPKHDTLSYSYRWADLSDGSVLSGAAPVVSPAVNTHYLATISHGEGCLIYDTLYVEVEVPTSISVAFTDERSVFDEVSGQIPAVVRATPPISVSTEHRITASIAINRDLIEISSLTSNKSGAVVTLGDDPDGYTIEIRLPSNYGMFDSINLLLSGRGFLTTAPFDSARITNIAYEGDLFCFELTPSPVATYIERVSQCGDEPIRDAWMRTLHNVTLERYDRSLRISSSLNGEYRITLYDMLGRILIPERIVELPATIELPVGLEAPILIHIQGAQGRYSRVFFP